MKQHQDDELRPTSGAYPPAPAQPEGPGPAVPSSTPATPSIPSTPSRRGRPWPFPASGPMRPDGAPADPVCPPPRDAAPDTAAPAAPRPDAAARLAARTLPRQGWRSWAWLCAFVAAALGLAAARAVAAATPAAEPRVALVIGNAAYAQDPLRNAVNDARAMAASLRRLGFTVLLHENAGKAAMEQAVLDYGRRIAAGGVGVFFYAGHGMQVRGRNFLVPVDAQIDHEAKTRVAAVDLDLLLEQVAEARNRVNLVILDACRNNPFEAKLRGGRSQGLAPVDAARGTLIAYATAPGSVASDGGSRNGLYTEELLKALDQPGLKIEEVFKRVRVAVSERSRGQQTPWESSSLTGDLVINVTVQVQVSPGGGATSATAPAAPSAAVDRDALFWGSIKDSRLPSDFEAYLRQFPEGTFAALARQRLAALGGPGGAARFDGTWAVTVSCPEAPNGGRAYRRHFLAEVREGRVNGDFGTSNDGGTATLSGRIEPDGTAALVVRGTTGDPRFSGGYKPGTPYGYAVVDARFEGDQGTGRRTEVRPCDLTFVRRGGSR